MPKKGLFFGIGTYICLLVALYLNKYTNVFPSSQAYADYFDSFVNFINALLVLLSLLAWWNNYISKKFKISEMKIKEKFKTYIKNLLNAKDCLAIVCRMDTHSDKDVVEYFEGIFPSIDRHRDRKVIVIWLVGSGLSAETQEPDPLREEAMSDRYSI